MPAQGKQRGHWGECPHLSPLPPPDRLAPASGQTHLKKGAVGDGEKSVGLELYFEVELTGIAGGLKVGRGKAT